MTDQVIGRGDFAGFMENGTFRTEYVAYVLTASREQIATGSRVVSPPFDDYLRWAAGEANIYDLNPVPLMARGDFEIGDSGYAHFFYSPLGTFDDFTVYENTGATATTDPVKGYVVANTNVNSGGAAEPWARYVKRFVPPKESAFVVPAAFFPGMAAGTHQFLDSIQIEEGAAETAFTPAREVQVKVRPTRLNYSKNPRFDSLADWATASGTLKNYVLNPSAEASSGTVTVATNLALNPAQVSTGYVATGGTRTWLTAQPAPWPLATALKVAPTGAWTQFPFLDLTPTTASARVTVKFYAATDASANATNWVLQDLTNNRTINTTGTHLDGSPMNATSTIAVGAGAAAAYHEVTFTLPANGAAFKLGLKDVGGAAGAPITLTAVQVEVGETLGNYFDGSTAAGGDFTYAWTGTAHASTSTKNGSAVAGYFAQNSKVTRSVEWAKSGIYSMRIASYGSKDSCAELGGPGNLYGMTPGATYTASGTIRLTAAQGGTPDTRARSITVYSWKAGAATAMLGSTAAPNAAGETRLAQTFTVPADADGVSVRFYNGSEPGGAEVWWDAVMIEEATAASPYFDGDMDGYVWDGTPHASTSSQMTEITRVADPDGGWNLDARGVTAVLHTVTGLVANKTYIASIELTDESLVDATVTNGTLVRNGQDERRPWVIFVASGDTEVIRFTPRVPDEAYIIERALVEDGSVLKPYFDGDSGDDYLWEVGGTVGLTRSYFYEDRSDRHHILVRSLRENVPLGTPVADPAYAAGPPTS